MTANILQAGAVFGVPMQPYEAHINQYMHFYGDYCLGGNEYIRISEFMIRHLPKLDSQTIRNKTFYPEIFKQSQRTEMSPSDHRNYSFLQNVPGLQFWHKDMEELKQVDERSHGRLSFDAEMDDSEPLPFGTTLTSPYPRTTYCDIEIDCNCSDILNVYERLDIVNMLSLSKNDELDLDDSLNKSRASNANQITTSNANKSNRISNSSSVYNFFSCAKQDLKQPTFSQQRSNAKNDEIGLDSNRSNFKLFSQ